MPRLSPCAWCGPISLGGGFAAKQPSCPAGAGVHAVGLWCGGCSAERGRCGAQSLRNTTAVPRHWSQKRKYLQGKRGLEKPAFVLPAFIEATGAPAPAFPLT